MQLVSIKHGVRLYDYLIEKIAIKIGYFLHTDITNMQHIHIIKILYVIHAGILLYEQYLKKLQRKTGRKI